MSTENLIARISAWTSPPFADRISKIVVEGAFPELPVSLGEPCLAIEQAERSAYDLGFDFETSKERGRVIGVRVRSNAFHAGLRDQQELVRWSFSRNDIAKHVELTVREGAQERVIRYLPRGAAIHIPQFVVANKDACPGRL